jgi:tetratricopeptide (TPR) repeat protein
MLVPAGLILVLIVAGIWFGLRAQRRRLGLALVAACVLGGGYLLYEIVRIELHNQRQAEAWPLVEKARVWLREGKKLDARAALNDALRIQPSEYVAASLRGGMCLDEKDYAGAERDFTTVLAHAPATHAEGLSALLGRAKARAMMKRPEAARADYDRAAELSPALRREIEKERDEVLGGP